MAITIRQDSESTNPLDALRLETHHIDTPAAQLARQRGILQAKTEALATATKLLPWARWLSMAIIAVSAVHLWETLAAIKPDDIAVLRLPSEVYHFSALALVAVIDCSIWFLTAAQGAAAYAGYRQQSRALGFLYTLTFLLNLAFLARHMPDLPPQIADGVSVTLAVLFPALLALLVPVSLTATERAAHLLRATRAALLVDVEMLRGMVAIPATPEQPPAQQACEGGASPRVVPVAELAHERAELLETPPQALELAEAPVSVAEEVRSAPVHVAAVVATPAADRTCKYCRQDGLTMTELMVHGRQRSRYGTCTPTAAQLEGAPATTSAEEQAL